MFFIIIFASVASFATSLSWDLKQVDGRPCAMMTAKQVPALFILGFAAMTTVFWTSGVS